jgi:hypothetical protein
MALTTGNYFKQQFDSVQAMGAKAIQSDFTIEIEGFERNYLQYKQFPWPVLSVNDPVEVFGPMGMRYFETANIEVTYQGSFSMYETEAGQADDLMIGLIMRGGKFDAKVYHGTPDHFVRMKPIYGAILKLDAPDLDFENRTQPLILSGQLNFHYFGEVVKGSVNTLNGSFS